MTTGIQKHTAEQLKRLIEQIETLEAEKAELAEDVRDKFAEAKAVGFDTKIIKKILRMRKQSQTERDEEEAVLATYLSALGMLADTPLGDYAVRVHKAAAAHGISKDIADQVAMEG